MSRAPHEVAKADFETSNRIAATFVRPFAITCKHARLSDGQDVVRTHPHLLPALLPPRPVLRASFLGQRESDQVDCIKCLRCKPELVMKLRATHTPLSVYMLADHLDAALAAGEDIMARGVQWRELAERRLSGPADSSDPADYAARQRKITDEIRGLELILLARIIKARSHALALAELDDRLRTLAQLFASGTAILLDAVEESGDARAIDFDTADEIIAYVRSRGLIAPDAAAIRTALDLTIDDSFLVAKRLALGPLLDMAAAFLDALEIQYDLFVEEETSARKALFVDLDDAERVPLN
jgi:hypothetical protein